MGEWGVGDRESGETKWRSQEESRCKGSDVSQHRAARCLDHWTAEAGERAWAERKAESRQTREAGWPPP